MRALGVIVLMLLLGACSRTSLNPDCPNGYTKDEVKQKCVCATDEGCPDGMRCESNVCMCRASSCCPSGYDYSTASATCVCHDSSCCPKDHVWLENEKKCTCGAQDCCPDGYLFNATSKACECSADSCCPVGHVWNATAMQCNCAATSCCPVDTVYDPLEKDCVCAKTECCPANHAFDPAIGACVCLGDSCCPTGFKKATDGSNRCVCIDNTSCPMGQFCDSVSGGCRCSSNAGCPAGDTCNALGFCQSLTSCTSNRDCPGGTFCDVTSSKCTVDGPCVLDDQCTFSSICQAATRSCQPGCRRDGDCAPKLSCVAGQCQAFCRTNEQCPVGQFCDTTAGTCATRFGRNDCMSCDSFANSCGSPDVSRCLGFITEGQTATFCGMICVHDADCPAGFGCDGVIFSCGNGGTCDAIPGDTVSCLAFLVENEAGDQFFCADSSAQPHEYFRACSPRSGFCPASPAP